MLLFLPLSVDNLNPLEYLWKSFESIFKGPSEEVILKELSPFIHSKDTMKLFMWFRWTLNLILISSDPALITHYVKVCFDPRLFIHW